MNVIIELNACLNTDLTKGEKGKILIEVHICMY